MDKFNQLYRSYDPLVSSKPTVIFCLFLKWEDVEQTLALRDKLALREWRESKPDKSARTLLSLFLYVQIIFSALLGLLMEYSYSTLHTS